jgi:hypothetical protein
VRRFSRDTQWRLPFWWDEPEQFIRSGSAFETWVSGAADSIAIYTLYFKVFSNSLIGEQVTDHYLADLAARKD